ncbi:hypothetical protein EV363DRAFT_1394620 [Boletus edulis]|nr:hypothetical protein EV363DRAFT_1394620 [Boletus edulis]
MVDDGKESNKSKICIYMCWYYCTEDVKWYDPSIAERMKRCELLNFMSIDSMVKVTHVNECITIYNETNDCKDPTSGFFMWWGPRGKQYCNQCKVWMHLRCLACVAKKVSFEWISALFKEVPIAHGGVYKTFKNRNEVMKVHEVWKSLKRGADVHGLDKDMKHDSSLDY